ncbi:MAG: crossover junction endodeoxyribonuclease RuvC [Cellvibrionales bacterium TMED49]|nr:crossover junction endodeoxyribonuclease RuvC [Porticoccaceae bacterium]OUU35570.1 MAG: crossover junction endodeoxyribonuclease RuvC [Cellvibrionales bacterium TMED49]|tara:strand:+ start:397 stop:921 length:525 start_codon:yes stop_codon:yes gene_type:complete
MTRVIGIDPGSRRTGFGIIDVDKTKLTYVASGIIHLKEKIFFNRLKIIFDDLSEVMDEYQPEHMSVEEVFFARDPRAALKLGQARGVALLAGVKFGIDIGEYSAKSIKLSVVGSGSADKRQVQLMVATLLKLSSPPPEDAADALATAICHAHSMATNLTLKGSLNNSYARGRNN